MTVYEEEYKVMLVTWRLDPGPAKVAEEIRAPGKRDWEVRVMKEVIEICVQDAEERWRMDGMWEDLWGVEDGEPECMCEKLADDVR
jgi:hypothetical protein